MYVEQEYPNESWSVPPASMSVQIGGWSSRRLTSALSRRPKRLGNWPMPPSRVSVPNQGGGGGGGEGGGEGLGGGDGGGGEGEGGGGEGS